MTFRIFGRRYKLTRKGEDMLDNLKIGLLFATGYAVIVYGLFFGL